MIILKTSLNIYQLFNNFSFWIIIDNLFEYKIDYEKATNNQGFFDSNLTPE